MFSVDFLDELRRAELLIAVRHLPPGAKLLEFGAGTGQQAKRLSELGFDVTAVDLPSSGYANSRVFPIIDYDGENIPLPDQSVDAIFSSNVLEHVENFPAIAREFHRISRAGAIGVHIMPSVAWRAWTFVSGYPTAAVIAASTAGRLLRPPPSQSRLSAVKQQAKSFAGALLPIGHGTSPEGISELWTFSASFWRRRFRKHGFRVIEEHPVGLFHTGHMLFARRLSIGHRRRLSRLIGSAANLFIVTAEADEERRSAGSHGTFVDRDQD